MVGADKVAVVSSGSGVEVADAYRLSIQKIGFPLAHPIVLPMVQVLGIDDPAAGFGGSGQDCPMSITF